MPEKVRRQVHDAHFAGLSDALKTVTPESLAANREMVRELNSLLQEKLTGGEPDVSGFLARYGELFPGALTIDDIIEQLAARMAQMQSLMASLSSEQRQGGKRDRRHGRRAVDPRRDLERDLAERVRVAARQRGA